MERRWILASLDSPEPTAEFWSELCGLPCIARHLMRKGFAAAPEVENFLRPRLQSLADPFALPQMAAAVARIFQALDRGERIVLYGDYDVDGVTSLALLAEMLAAYGAAPALFLPLRMDEGYGLSRDGVERCCQEHRPELLIAVDCGTSSAAEIAELARRGVDTIVLDHHEPKAERPPCAALVNPKATGDGAFDYLCSVGVVFKLCHALLKTRPCVGFELKRQLDLVALGTVADIVPLRGENRVLVQRGLRELAQTTRPGLRKLMELAGARPPLCAEDIGFRLGPRLNAAGRLTTAQSALRLLLTRDETEAAGVARLLDAQNRERQTVEKQVLAAAEEQVAEQFDSARDAAIVVGARGWHPGVLGIVASRLVRKFHRPALVIGFDENGVGKGSGRSIDGLSLVAALAASEAWLVKYGGHEMAAGLTIEEKNFAPFAEAFRAAAAARLTTEHLLPRLQLDHELTLAEVNLQLWHWHEMLQPFGNGNAQPLFLARAVEPAAEPRVLKEKHVLLRLKQRQHHQRAIFFDGAAAPLPAPPWDVAFRLAADEYEGELRLQMQVQALRTAADF